MFGLFVWYCHNFCNYFDRGFLPVDHIITEGVWSVSPTTNYWTSSTVSNEWGGALTGTAATINQVAYPKKNDGYFQVVRVM
jgi:hypothetical protein